MIEYKIIDYLKSSDRFLTFNRNEVIEIGKLVARSIKKRPCNLVMTYDHDFKGNCKCGQELKFKYHKRFCPTCGQAIKWV